MSATVQTQPTSILRFGCARVDITPPDGIYHPMWGAARHHRATGVHRPLVADVMLFAPAEVDGPAWVQAQLDLVGLAEETHDKLAQALAEGSGVPRDQVILAYSHTHASGMFSLDRTHFPGGELIEPYLIEVQGKLRDAARRAVEDLQFATITYAPGHCTLAANRDYWDDARGIYACGFNPDAPADGMVIVARVCDAAANVRAVLVNYACHPTTLAWDNTLVSPDYVGALRETVENVVGAPCIYTLGACGDLGPRAGFVGETAVADANGRHLGYAALTALASMDAPGVAFVYAGPVVSGATLATWAEAPATPARRAMAEHFAGAQFVVNLPQKPRPDPATLQAQMENWRATQVAADAAGDAIAARDAGAQAERARRALARVQRLPAGPDYPFHFTVRRLGDAVWVSTGGEPYNTLQTTLRARFPGRPIIVTTVAGEWSGGYLLPANRYGVGLYQEEPSCYAAGSLELLIDAISARIEETLS